MNSWMYTHTVHELLIIWLVSVKLAACTDVNDISHFFMHKVTSSLKNPGIPGKVEQEKGRDC